MPYENEDSEIEGMLGDLPQIEYPDHLLEQRREAFRDQIREQKSKKKGCPLALLTFLAIFGALSFVAYKVYTGIILEVASLYIWMLSF